MDVGAVEPAQEHLGGAACKQAGDDLGPRLFVRRGSEGRQRHVQRPAEVADLEVIRTEVVAPLADAMGLVHRDGGDARAAEEGDGLGRSEAFGGEVQKPQRAVVDGLEDALPSRPSVLPEVRAHRRSPPPPEAP